MDWQSLLNQERSQRPKYVEQTHRPLYVQDLDRIAFSAPFRRLAHKTQVHPLYENDHLHHRLIHSIETASVGRSLGIEVGHWLEEQSRIESGKALLVGGIVQAACLAHDIGNPPFGHSGEAAIGAWFSDKFTENLGIFSEIPKDDREEFEAFEGNAQGFRILTRLEMYRNAGGMQLSNAVLGAYTKYPSGAVAKDAKPESYCGLKKFGYFRSEEVYFEDVAQKCNLLSGIGGPRKWWKRHPLAFLVEAADDITYGIIDIEDAYCSGLLSYKKTCKILEPICGVSNNDTSHLTEAEHVSYLRARSIGAAISFCVEAFKNHYAEIMSGKFNDSLIASSDKADAFHEIEVLSRGKIYPSDRKMELEVYGRNLLHNTLNGLIPIFQALHANNWDSSKLSSYEKQVTQVLNIDLRDARDASSALHILCDYVSGMTDRYTVKTSNLLGGTA